MATVLAAVMAACGGGGGGDSGETTVAVRVEGLSASSLTLVDDLGHTAVVGANGVQTFARMPVGTVFTPAVFSQPSNQVCRMDAGVRTAASGLELLVRCDAGLLTTSALSSYAVDQMVVMDTLEAGTVSAASLGGQTLTFAEAANGGFTFRVPALAAGTHELRAVVNGRAFTTTLEITANPLAVAPDVFLRSAATDALADIAAQLADPATTDEERTALLELQTALNGLDAALAGASSDDLQSLARLLAANDPDVWLAAGDMVSPARVGAASVTSRVSAAAVQPNVALCDRYSRRLGISVTSTVALMAMTNLSMTSGYAAPLSALTAYGFIRMLKRTMDDAGGVVDHCVDAVAMPILKIIRTSPQSKDLASGSVAAQSLARVQAQASTSASMAFNHGEAGLLEVRLQKTLLAEATDRLLNAAARLVDLHSTLAAFVADFVTLPGGDLVARLRTLQRNFSEPAQALSLEALPAGFTGSIAPVLDTDSLPTGRYTVVFRSSVEPTSSQPLLFSFRLRETEADYLGPVISATLQVPLTPVASDLAFETNVGSSLSAHLTATNATGFALLSQPASGRVVLDDVATGAFTYTPVAGYTGTVSFTYRASNSRATSQTATVVIGVMAQCALYRGTSSDGPYFRNECMELFPTGFAEDGAFFASRVPVAGISFSLADGATQTVYTALREMLTLPSGRPAQVAVESVSRDAVSDTFTLDISRGEYVTGTGAAASPSADQLSVERSREKALFVRHPGSGRYVVGGLTRASAVRLFFADGVVRLYELNQEVVTLEGLDSGAPIYRTRTTRCRLALDPDTASVVGWTVEVANADNLTTTGTSRVTSDSCPLSEATLLSVGPEKGLNDLTFNWR